MFSDPNQWYGVSYGIIGQSCSSSNSSLIRRWPVNINDSISLDAKLGYLMSNRSLLHLGLTLSKTRWVGLICTIFRKGCLTDAAYRYEYALRRLACLRPDAAASTTTSGRDIFFFQMKTHHICWIYWGKLEGIFLFWKPMTADLFCNDFGEKCSTLKKQS